MIYLISDIHGQYDDFQKLLKKIKFDRKVDKMIIMGDVLDRGPDPIELLQLIRTYIDDGSMKMIMGNHELFAIMALGKKFNRTDVTERFGELDESKWATFAGKTTIAGLEQLDDEDQEELLDFLIKLPFYYEIKTVFCEKTVITHSGIDCDSYVMTDDGKIDVVRSIEQGVHNNIFKALCGIDLHFVPIGDKRKFNKFVIVGHHPCYRLDPEHGNSIFRSKYYLDIDTGAGHKDEGGRLCCYSVDRNEEIYL